MIKILSVFLIISPLVFAACKTETEKVKAEESSIQDDKRLQIQKSEEEWKKILSEDEYYVLREKGTEPAFSGKYVDHKEEGIYVCAGCGNELFSSKTKFKSGTGWPSYWAPISERNIILKKDTSLGMIREEILCARCGGHLGHIFEDGPEPTGLRYCVNSVAMDFKSLKE